MKNNGLSQEKIEETVVFPVAGKAMAYDPLKCCNFNGDLKPGFGHVEAVKND